MKEPKLKSCPFCGSDLITHKNKLYFIHDKSANCILLDIDINFHVINSVDAIEQWNSRTPAWIPVTERLPKETAYYIGYSMNDSGHEFVFPIVFIVSIAAWQNCDGSENDHITHWQPLPEPIRGQHVTE